MPVNATAVDLCANSYSFDGSIELIERDAAISAIVYEAAKCLCENAPQEFGSRAMFNAFVETGSAVMHLILPPEGSFKYANQTFTMLSTQKVASVIDKAITFLTDNVQLPIQFLINPNTEQADDSLIGTVTLKLLDAKTVVEPNTIGLAIMSETYNELLVGMNNEAPEWILVHEIMHFLFPIIHTDTLLEIVKMELSRHDLHSDISSELVATEECPTHHSNIDDLIFLALLNMSEQLSSSVPADNIEDNAGHCGDSDKWFITFIAFLAISFLTFGALAIRFATRISKNLTNRVAHFEDDATDRRSEDLESGIAEMNESTTDPNRGVVLLTIPGAVPHEGEAFDGQVAPQLFTVNPNYLRNFTLV